MKRRIIATALLCIRLTYDSARQNLRGKTVIQVFGCYKAQGLASILLTVYGGGSAVCTSEVFEYYRRIVYRYMCRWYVLYDAVKGEVNCV